MAFYWRLRSIPELRPVPRESRREWWREAMAQTRTGTDRLLLVLIVAVSVAAARLLVHALHWNQLEGYAATAALAGVLGYALEASGQPRARRWLQGHLKPGQSTRP